MMASIMVDNIQKRLQHLAPISSPSEKKLTDLDEGYFTSTSIGSPDCGTPADVMDRGAHRAACVQPDDEPYVVVIGCGYVGTHLVGSFSTKYSVLGYDISEKQLASARADHGDRASFTTNPEAMAEATHFLVSVPTLLRPDKSIDTSYIRSALKTISQHARRGATVVIESSVAVGMTRELVGPLAVEKGFFVGMSPERVDPGRTEPPMRSIPKVISGLDDVAPGSLAAISRLYSPVFDNIVPVSRPEVAEMMKLYENCQRMVCIAYANEMANACIPLGINPYEVCNAAATKPFGYMPFAPSLGVGGHCIPVNPYYLLSNLEFPLLKAATETMWQRPSEIGQKALDELVPEQQYSRVPEPITFEHIKSAFAAKLSRESLDSAIDVSSLRGSTLFSSSQSSSSFSSPRNSSLFSSLHSPSPAPVPARRPRVLVVGAGFKTGQSNLSNSPGLQLAQYLSNSGKVDALFADTLVGQAAIPHIPRLADDEWNKQSLETFDMIIVAFKQTGMDLGVLDQLDGVRVQRWFN